MELAFKKAPRINELLKSAFNKKFGKGNMIEDVDDVYSMRSVELGQALD